jgi:uncharacterized Fe-S center protein
VTNAIILLVLSSSSSIFSGEGEFGHKVGGNGKVEYKVMVFENCTRSWNIIKFIKSRKMQWAGHVARIEETRKSP